MTEPGLGSLKLGFRFARDIMVGLTDYEHEDLSFDKDLILVV